jgi:hypothetical protein
VSIRATASYHHPPQQRGAALKIDYQGLEPKKTLAREITDQVKSLEPVFGRITARHVGVKAPGHHHRIGGLFEVRAHLTLPDGREVKYRPHAAPG